MKIFTIGFTKKSAETFFTSLKNAGVKRLVDVRLNNISQLAGFTRKDDLRYFTRAICEIEYVHLRDLAPTQDTVLAPRTVLPSSASGSSTAAVVVACTHWPSTPSLAEASSGGNSQRYREPQGVRNTRGSHTSRSTST